MVTPTTKNPYLLYAEEPPDWKGPKTWEQHKKDTEKSNNLWWEVHTKDGNYPHQMETPLGVDGSDFPLGEGNRYGPFIYCPLPITGVVRWGFRRAEGLATFKADVENDSLPKGGSVKAVVPSARRKPAATVEPVSKDPQTQTQVAAIVQTREMEKAADIDLSADLDLSADEPDPFADLDVGSEPTASAVEDDPFADLDIGAPEPESAPAEPSGGDGDEPEVDEWGEVIVKPKKTDDEDPFAGLV